MTNSRQQMGKVKLRVRENALRMREFTVDQMVKATGFNQESVQSEVRRMRKKGFLTVTDKAPPKQRGAPSCVYRVSDDSEVRLKLASEIEEFYPKAEKEDHPTSQHYFEARELLDHVEGGEVPESARPALLNNANDELEFAWHEEGEPKGAVNAFIKCQVGRLEYLRGNYEESEKVLLEAQKIFDEVGAGGQQHCAPEYLSALAVKRQWERSRSIADDSNVALVDRTEAAMNVIQRAGGNSLTQNPLSALLFGLVKELLAAFKDSMRPVVIADANAQLHSTPKRANAMAASAAHSAARSLYLPVGLGFESEEGSSRGEPMDWTHNLPDDYQYAHAVRSGSQEPLEFLAVNSSLGRGPGAVSLKTDVQIKRWGDVSL
jgi:hypothetical protein